MKTIVIAYDGSEGSDAILSELQHAGLPPQVNAHVVTVAKGWAVPDLAAQQAIPGISETESSAQTGRTLAMNEAKTIADQGAESLRGAFPDWTVDAAGFVGSAAQVIVQRAREVSADGIFVGSYSRPPVGSLFLGSVAQKVAAEAKCSVHICRSRPSSGTVPKLLIALDGSRSSQAAAGVVAERSWPTGTEVALVNVVEPPLPSQVDSLPSETAVEIRRQHAARLAWLESRGTAAERLFDPSEFVFESHTLDGEPKSTLLEWAKNWNADCLFTGTTGLNDMGDDTLGTVASALAVRAHCSVEIVRS